MSGLLVNLGPISASRSPRWEMDLRFQEAKLRLLWCGIKVKNRNFKNERHP